MSIDTFFQLLIGGLSIGALYALPALGITLIWNAAGVFNFANGDFVMIASFLTYTLTAELGLPFFATFIVVVVFMYFFGVATEKVIVNTLRKQGKVSTKSLVSFIALALFLRNAARFIWGTTPVTIKNPFGSSPIKLPGDVYVMPHTFWILGISLVLMLVLVLLFKKTKLGIAMRATTQNRTVASLMGVNTNWMIGFVFGLSSAIAGVAGLLSSPVFFATLDMGTMFGTKAFASNIIGGFGSPIGAVVGGLLIGVIETFGASLISSQAKDFITFSLLLVFLVFRPKGIFKLETTEKV